MTIEFAGFGIPSTREILYHAQHKMADLGKKAQPKNHYAMG